MKFPTIDTSGFTSLPDTEGRKLRIVPALSLLGFTEKRKAENGDLTNIRKDYEAYREAFIRDTQYEHADDCKCEDCIFVDMTNGDYDHITDTFI